MARNKMLWRRALVAALLVATGVTAGCTDEGPVDRIGGLETAAPFEIEVLSPDVAIGITEHDPDVIDSADTDWLELKVRYVRTVVGWDVALLGRNAPERQRFAGWLKAVALIGAEPMVVFAASTYAPLPTVEDYRWAIEEFRFAFPTVATFGPWNEPDRPTPGSSAAQPDAALAVAYWTVLRDRCSHCTVVAGEFSDTASDAYVKAYTAALGGSPAVWSFHDHSDMESFQLDRDRSAPAARRLLRLLQGRDVWITETGAWYATVAGNGDITAWLDQKQANGAAFLLGIAKLGPVKAILYSDYALDCEQRCADVDQALVVRNGSAPIYDTSERRRCAFGVIAVRGPVIDPATTASGVARGTRPVC